MAHMKRDIVYRMKEILNRLTLMANKTLVDDTPLYLKLYGRESVERRRFCNIAAGGHFDFGCGLHHPCWVNVDLDRPWKSSGLYPKGAEFDPSKDIAHDLLSLEPIPVETDSMEIVHSRLAIEHITDQAARVMFGETHRMLKDGGLFRVIAPNIDLDYTAYRLNDMEYFDWFPDGVSIEQRFLFHFAATVSEFHMNGEAQRITDGQFRDLFKTMSFEDALDYCCSRCSVDLQRRDRYLHINWWNPAKLRRMLEEAGFSDITLSAAGQSRSCVLRNQAHFDNWYRASGYAKHMFYMEAIK